MAARVAWTGGGSGSIEALEGDRISLASDRAFAPGSRPEGTLEGEPKADADPTPPLEGQRIWVKVHGSRRRDDATFHVTGRLLNPTRELRQLLKEAAIGPIGGKKPNS